MYRNFLKQVLAALTCVKIQIIIFCKVFYTHNSLFFSYGDYILAIPMEIFAYNFPFQFGKQLC